MIESISDEQILDLIASPETLEKGFRILVKQYQERLYWHIRRMVTHHQDADDVIQNTFIKVYRHIGKFEHKSKLYSWLYRIASNEAITYINKRKKHTSIDIKAEMNQLENRLKADEFFDGDAAQLKLAQAVSTLPDKQKQVFNFRYYEEMAYAEISAILGTSVGGLKASYHIAVKKIESYLRADV